MVDRISFSSQELSLEQIAAFHADTQAGLFDFFSGNSQKLLDRYTGERIEDARIRALEELDRVSALSVLSAIEASVRVDYLGRVYNRGRDPLSKTMKDLHKEKQNKARLEADLLGLWRTQTQTSKVLLDELIKAFKYRHWLAHGRYWTPKLGRAHDYQSVYGVAQEFMEAMDEYDKS